jgi:hypothetical protein
MFIVTTGTYSNYKELDVKIGYHYVIYSVGNRCELKAKKNKFKFLYRLDKQRIQNLRIEACASFGVIIVSGFLC